MLVFYVDTLTTTQGVDCLSQKYSCLTLFPRRRARGKVGQRARVLRQRAAVKEVFKSVAEMCKKIPEERKAFYQTRADEANRDSGL
tara:strand:- start:105 stop:362 length:258 start_codon:yes stop_codon:yes gene_type:complete